MKTGVDHAKSNSEKTVITVETTWSRFVVEPKEAISGSDEKFFSYENHGNYFITKPDDIPYDVLASLQGRKTRVTIEVIPW